MHIPCLCALGQALQHRVPWSPGHCHGREAEVTHPRRSSDSSGGQQSAPRMSAPPEANARESCVKDGERVKTSVAVETGHFLIDLKISLTDEMKVRLIGKKDM